MREAQGGKNIYGFAIGILTLESSFPRIPGDVANATTWNFPVLYKVIKRATADAVVRRGDRDLLEPFIEGARELEREGVRAITTSCGFLAMFQRELAAAVNVPVFSSSLMQVPLAYAMLKPSQKVGIITVDSELLTEKHLESVGAVNTPHVIFGTEGEKEFTRVLLGDERALDFETSKHELVEVAKRMAATHPEVGAIVLECTNMPPYAAAIQEELRLPVFDIYTLVNLVYHASVRKGFSGYM